MKLYIDRETYITVPIDGTNVLLAEEGDKRFSWRGCTNCNNGLGSDVTDCTIAVYGQAMMEWTISLCDKCLYEHYYGVGSYEN